MIARMEKRQVDKESTMISTLKYVSVIPGTAHIHEHPVPEYWECQECGSGNESQYKLRITKVTAEQLGGC
jgi:hypothetical protein